MVGTCGESHRGQSRRRWTDDVKDITVESLIDLLTAAKDLDKRRTMTSTITRNRPQLDGTMEKLFNTIMTITAICMNKNKCVAIH